MLPSRLGIQSLNRVEVILALLHQAHHSTPYLFHTSTLPIMSSVYRYPLPEEDKLSSSFDRIYHWVKGISVQVKGEDLAHCRRKQK